MVASNKDESDRKMKLWIPKINVTVLTTIIYFSFCFCVSCYSQTDNKKINGFYKTPHPSFSTSKVLLKNGKFKMITIGDAGKSKGRGNYIINWNDSTITFNVKKTKSKRYNQFYKRIKSKDSMVFKINNTSIFSFDRFRKEE